MLARVSFIVAVALSLAGCLTTAAEQAREADASDDAACRSTGAKPGTPPYAKCRQDLSNRRSMSAMAARIGMQNDTWAMQQMNTQQMFRPPM